MRSALANSDFMLRSASDSAERSGRLRELKSIRRMVDRTWRTHGGVGGGMAELIRLIDLRIKRLNDR